MEKTAAVYIFIGDRFIPAGLLSTQVEGRFTTSKFQYGRRYLEREERIAVDPVQLPLVDGIQNTPQDFALFNGVRDAGPDKWGRYLLEKKFPVGLDEYDYVMAGENDRVGALAFGPDTKSGPLVWGLSGWHPLKTGRLDIEKIAAAIAGAEDPNDRHFKQYLDYGPSIGGARPKGTVDWKGEAYIAKFSMTDDRIAMCELEYATMMLAEKAGIRIPPIGLTSASKKKVYLVQRFDRWKDKGLTEESRNHFISALTATGEHESDYGNHSYLEIADQIGVLSEKPRSDRHELFRRMVFNIFVNNSDDHLRNHGFLSTGRQKWRLSPAYDLVPALQSTHIFRLALNVGAYGKEASLRNALSESVRFDLGVEEAVSIIEEVRAAVSSWKKLFLECGLKKEDLTKLSLVIRPELSLEEV